jgi:hypothetical protein
MAADDSSTKRVVGRPFPPGVSGNPGGQPPEFKTFKKWLAEEALEPAKQALMECLLHPDGKVRMMAVKEALDRLFGRSPQAITGPDGAPLNFGSALIEMVADLAKRGK